jgi:hypothetical protein
MSEQEKPKSFMQELDEWSMAKVIDPLHDETTCQILDCGLVVERVKKAIRTKVLESYRNGQVAGPRKPVQQERRKVYQR